MRTASERLSCNWVVIREDPVIEEWWKRSKLYLNKVYIKMIQNNIFFEKQMRKLGQNLAERSILFEKKNLNLSRSVEELIRRMASLQVQAQVPTKSRSSHNLCCWGSDCE